MINILTNFASETSTDGGGGFGALGVNGKAFIIQLITWIFVFFILRRFVFGPVVKLLQKRQETIEKGVELSTEMVAEKKKLEEEVEKTMAKARKEANEIIAKTNDQAGQIVKEAEEHAKERVDQLLKDAKSKIADETEKARRALEKDMVNLVIQATEAVASEKLDPAKDAVLIDKALKGKA